MRYPIPRQRRAPIFWAMLALTIVINRLMAGSLTTLAAPYGIVSLELAGTESKARAIIDSWDVAAQEHALFEAIENAGLLNMLQGRFAQPWPLIAQWFAIPKFVPIVLGLVYTLVVGGGLRLRRRLRKEAQHPSAGVLSDA